MFNKLISNLPFNPSLIDQVSFYTKRLSKESGIRRAGFAFIALTMALQVFATISPIQASVTQDPSGNDIIPGGFSTKAEAVKHCRNNDYSFGSLLLVHGITCDKLATAQEKSVSSTAYGNQLRSVGRKHLKKQDVYTTYSGIKGDFYWRPLSSWGNFTSKMLVTSTNDNQLLMVMFECGNLVKLSDFKLKQPEPDSNLKVSKVNSPSGEVKAGDTIDYTLAYTNKGGPAAFFSVNDVLPNEVEYVSSSQGNWVLENNAPKLRWHNGVPPYYVFGNTDAFGTPGFITVKVRVKNNIPSGTTICNRAYLQDVPKGGSGTRNSSEVQACNTVIVECPAGQTLNDDRISCTQPAVPDAVCVSLSVAPLTDAQDNKKFKFTARSAQANNATISQYTYNFGDGKDEANKTTSLEDNIEHTYKSPGTYDASVVVKTSVGDKTGETCKTKVIVNPPDKSPTIVRHKKAANLTRNQSNTNGKKAYGGDVIEYTLTTTNISSVVAKNEDIWPEDLSDVLEYATLDISNLDGGVFDQDKNVLAWPQKVDIKPGQTITKKFKVKVKKPIPSTPRPDVKNNRSSGDLLMTNWYGDDSVEIKLPSTPVKNIEKVNETLPNTGPGTSLLVGFLVMTIAGYFFARSRLLARELTIVKNDYIATDGGN